MKKKLLRLLIALSIMVCATLALVGCTKPALVSPENLKVDDAVTVLSWSPVSGARAYIIKIEGDNGFEDEIEVRKVSYGISTLETNVTYTFSVSAVGDKINNSNSDWSEELEVFKPYENGMMFRSINGSTEYEVSSIGSATRTTTEVEIPDTYRGKPVTKVGKSAFYNNSRITKITIPSSITEIGERAFRNCVSISEIVIPDSVVTMGAGAFQGCTSLKKATISDNLVELPSNAFYGCSILSDVVFGEKIETIGENAFFRCINLGVTKTENPSDPENPTLTYHEVVLPDSVKTIGASAFFKCAGLKVFDFSSTVTIGASAFSECSTLTEVSFGDSLETISSNAFELCSSLEEVVLPDSILEIGDKAFLGCVALDNISFGESLEKIGADAFDGTVYWTEANEGEFVYIDNWLVSTKFPKVTDFNVGPTYLEIEDGTIGLAADAVRCDINMKESDEGERTYYGSALETIVIPSSVRSIGKSAFNSSLNLIEVIIGNEQDGSDLKLIDSTAFYNCTELYNLTIFGNSLETIGDQAFGKCSSLGYDPVTRSLKDIKLPDSLRTIGTNAFIDTYFWGYYEGAVYVGGWVVGRNTKSINTITIDPVKNDITTVGIANYGLYYMAREGDSEDEDVLAEVALPDTIKYIGRSAFYKCGALIGITIPEQVEKIEDYTFAYCLMLRNINLGNVKEIGNYAFYNAGSYESNVDDGSAPVATTATITGLENAETIGNYAFYNNKFVKSITLGENLISVGNRAFFGMGLTSLDIPGSLKEIGSYAFANNASLVSLIIREGVETIGRYAFSNNSATSSVILPSTIKTVGDYAFRKNSSMAVLKLNEGLESIGKSAFVECTSLTELDIPETVKSIGNMAFRSCTALTGVVLKDTVETMGMHVFYGTKATFYTEMTSIPTGWSIRWNTSNRPILFGCTFSEDGSYVVSFTKNADTLKYFTVNVPTVDEEGNEVEAKDPIVAPIRDGYEFLGWATTEDGGVQFEASEVYAAEPDQGQTSITLYAVWDEIN